MSNNNYKTWVEISTGNLASNVKAVRGLLKEATNLMAVVKSNAYGHGLVETGKIFSKLDLDWIGVDHIDEAIELRKNGISLPMLVIGFTPEDRFREALENKVSLTIYNKLKSTPPEGVSFHIKVDTGMSRQGVLVSELEDFINSLPRGLNIQGVLTHFANADNLSDRAYPEAQLASFYQSLEIFNKKGINPKIIHSSATPAFFTMPESQFNLVRIGIAFYGLWPSSDFSDNFKKLGLLPALSWKTRIVQIKEIEEGRPVGYGITETVKKKTKIAVLPIGYYDGYNRSLSSIGEVLIGGKRSRVLGRISMNLMVVDITGDDASKIWDEVVLIGNQGEETITAEDVARKIGTISYEIVCRINPLLPRIYI